MPRGPQRRLEALRASIRRAQLLDERVALEALVETAALDRADRQVICERAASLVREIRADSAPGIMESFLAEYGLSTREGVALMCLAEALLRVPDPETIDALIEDKIAPSAWGEHLGHSSSSLVNASTWALLLTGKVLTEAEEGVAGALRGALRRLGEPVIRRAVGQAMRELGRQFVLGRTIEEALRRARGMLARGYTYSYDMLGEAAHTEADARRYHLAYSDAITALAGTCSAARISENPGVSVKLSALHPRYEMAQRDRVMSELAARARSLALLAKSANMSFTIDAEEAERLDLSLDVIESVLAEPALEGWDGLGVVVQTYGPRAPAVLDWLHALAEGLDRRIMVRLAKGAYWDTEIKRAQVLGLRGYPVFTRRASTDVSYIACARRLLGMRDRIYPQFATHNAHTVAAVLHLAGAQRGFEFQRLHGMGETLHEKVREEHAAPCRIYAPVGAHRDLLAYLVRRLLENGANSSFVNQIVDQSVSPEEVARDPFEVLDRHRASIVGSAIPSPDALYGPLRRNSRGWDLADPRDLAELQTGRLPFRAHRWHAAPLVAGSIEGAAVHRVANPARPQDTVGEVVECAAADVETALAAARGGYSAWSATSLEARAACLRRAADLYEAHACELFALAAREAGKTLADAVAELREAVDFLRYYAAEAEAGAAGGEARGVFACISPWNFPLAIFTGQIAAALVVGNAVLAKPAEQAPLMAARAVALLHQAGVPAAALQLLPGAGAVVGAALARDPRVDGICFTGSTATALTIARTMAEHLAPDAPLIAETGGLNAMLVDSTALPEQAVRDVVASAFQSAGQRCSALRILYVQDDVAERVLEMLRGAMAQLRVGDPWVLSTDVGPVIDIDARERIEAHCERLTADGRLLARLDPPAEGCFVPPTILRVSGIEELEEEVFGPVLHVASFPAEGVGAVIEAINARGYGLTFGLHTRIDDRVQQVVEQIRVGNVYVNRNQIGAVVGSQPFGGEGLSGTGPKAGGPHYLPRFTRRAAPRGGALASASISAAELQCALDALRDAARADAAPSVEHLTRLLGELGASACESRPEPLELAGPTGESNRLSLHPRGVVLCLGPGRDAALAQAAQALVVGNAVVVADPQAVADAGRLARAGAPVAVLRGPPEPRALSSVRGFDAVACVADTAALRTLRIALAARDGPLVPLITESGTALRYALERHVCVDTTAAGGNASLLAAVQG